MFCKGGIFSASLYDADMTDINQRAIYELRLKISIRNDFRNRDTGVAHIPAAIEIVLKAVKICLGKQMLFVPLRWRDGNECLQVPGEKTNVVFLHNQ